MILGVKFSMFLKEFSVLLSFPFAQLMSMFSKGIFFRIVSTLICWAFNEIEKNNEQATPNSLFELKAYAFVQHCQNFNFKKADDCEYDIKFLVRNFGITGSKIAKKYMTSGEYSEIEKIIKSVKF